MFGLGVIAILAVLVGSAQEQDGRIGLVGDDGKLIVSIPAHGSK